MGNRVPTHSEISPYIESGLVRANRHPELPLTIYNYSDRVQYDRIWDRITMACRGLILADDGTVVARPFEKFWNFSEHEGPLPDEPHRVYEKLDGSLLIVAEYDGVVVAATRGSFVSDQAAMGRRLFLQRDWWAGFDFGVTYLFEVIYPENRIVVDYGGRTELVHLATIDNETGRTVATAYPPFRSAEEYQLSLADLQTMVDGGDNAEGYVIHFQGESDLRLKFKFSEYVRIHKLLSGISERVIWEYISQGKGIIDIFADVPGAPDEMYDWVDSTANRLWNGFCQIESECDLDVYDRPQGVTRKDLAAYFSTCKYPHVLFLSYDGHHEKAEKAIWDLVKPKGSKPYQGGES